MMSIPTRKDRLAGMRHQIDWEGIKDEDRADSCAIPRR